MYLKGLMCTCNWLFNNDTVEPPILSQTRACGQGGLPLASISGPVPSVSGLQLNGNSSHPRVRAATFIKLFMFILGAQSSARP